MTGPELILIIVCLSSVAVVTYMLSLTAQITRNTRDSLSELQAIRESLSPHP